MKTFTVWTQKENSEEVVKKYLGLGFIVKLLSIKRDIRFYYPYVLITFEVK